MSLSADLAPAPWTMEKSDARDSTSSTTTGGGRGGGRRGAIEFKEGAKIEAKDHLGDKWWEAKVLEVDVEGSEVLVHFTGWNGR